MNISSDGNHLSIDGGIFPLPSSIVKVAKVKDLIVVLLDPDPLLSKAEVPDSNHVHMVSNLIGLTSTRSIAWEAELPWKVDYYSHIVSEEPLIAASLSSYKCEIDTSSGKIKSKTLFK